MNCLSKKSGIALIMTLMLVIMLATIVGQLSYSTQVDVYIAQNSSDDLQLRYALISAANYAIAQLQLDAMQEEGGEKKYDALTDEWAKPSWTDKKPQKIGNAEVYYTISDEGSKFNLLRLLEKPKEGSDSHGEGKPPKKSKAIPPADQFDRLLEIAQGDKAAIQPSKIRESIVSWMKEKKGKDGKSAGPFPTKVPLFSMKELLMAKDITPAILWGIKSSKEKEEIVKGLEDYTTLWSEGKININTAPIEVIQSLNPKIDEEMAKRIDKYRDQNSADGQKQTFTKIEDLQKIDGMNEPKDDTLYSKVEELICVKSSYFTIIATASCGRILKKMRVVAYRQGKSVYKLYCEYEE